MCILVWKRNLRAKAIPKSFMPIYESFCFGVQGCEVYLLSSFLLLNTFGSGKKDNVFSARGSWGTSVVLNRCTSCCFGLSVWRIPAKRYSKTGNLLCLSISFFPPIICICESWLQQNYNKVNKTKTKFLNLIVYLAAFTSEQPIVISWHFVSADRAAFLRLWCSF